MDRIYGCPGTTELALLCAATQRGLRYYFAWHDSVAMGMADGFARASGRLAVANLHSAQGLLNASGLIRVALRDETPLLIVAGLPSTEYDIHEPNHHLPNLQQCLTPITKWGWTVANEEILVHALGRAIHMSLSPPRGPTFVCLPQDILESEASGGSACRAGEGLGSTPETLPAPDRLQRAAEMLSRASTPLLFAGYGAQHAVDSVERLSHLAAAPVIGEALDRGIQLQHVYCRASHPLFLGFFDGRDSAMREALSRADVIVFVGGKRTYPRVIGELPAACAVVHLSPGYADVGKDHRADVTLVGSLEHTLPALCDRLEGALGGEERGSHVAARRESVIAQVERSNAEREGALGAVSMSGSPVTGMQVVKAMSEHLPPDAVIVDESQCLGYYLKRYYRFERPETLYGSLGGHLGWGLPASIGVKQARRESPVICAVSGTRGCSSACRPFARWPPSRSPCWSSSRTMEARPLSRRRYPRNGGSPPRSRACCPSVVPLPTTRPWGSRWV